MQSVGATNRAPPPPPLLSATDSSNQSSVAMSVAIPSAKPSPAQIADAFFSYFGFERDDTAFLKRNFHHVDPFAYFARTLAFDPRSVTTTANAQSHIRLEVSTEAYTIMKQLAALHHPAPAATLEPVDFSIREAGQVKSGFDHSTLLKNKLQSQQTSLSKAHNTEGLGAFLEGAVAGDFSTNETWSKVCGQVLSGALPVYGQIADARDTLAALGDVRDGRQGAGVGLAAALIGWVPVVGDGVKMALKASTKVAQRLANEGMQELTPLGGRAIGSVSRREFDPDLIGTPIRNLSIDNIKVTPRGINFVERHLSRFDSHKANQTMVQRLRDIADGKIAPTAQDLNFYAHELRESVRYKLLGFQKGQPVDPDKARLLWNNAHSATLEDYRIRESHDPLNDPLYHPNAAKYFFGFD